MCCHEPIRYLKLHLMSIFSVDMVTHLILMGDVQWYVVSVVNLNIQIVCYVLK